MRFKTLASHVLWIILLTASQQTFLRAQNKITISGYIYEKGSKETLLGVNVYAPKYKAGTVSNNYGFYSITLPKDTIDLVFSFVGYQPISKKIMAKNETLDIYLPLASVEIGTVEITAEQEKLSETSKMSSINLPVSQVQKIPVLLGEKDVMKAIQLMPGVQKGSEGNTGLYVRGGGPDQNLIILDDAIVYNASHLFGFFSVFNGDAVKSMELIKGGFPSQYGGRLSSVLDITMKDGNKEQWGGHVGIGLLSSRFMVEGPLKKNKSSLLISGRRTYIDVLAYPFMPEEEKIGYYFYDLNAKLSYDLSRKDKLFVSGYFGKDRFYLRYKDDNNYNYGKYSEKSNFFWGNATATARWNHLFNDQLFVNTSFIFSNYRLEINTESKTNSNLNYLLRYYSGIRDFAIKSDFMYLPNPNHTIKMGFISMFHHFTPKALVLKSDYEYDQEDINKRQITNTLENGLYLSDDIKITERWRTNAGLRLSHYLYDNKNYLLLEPRISTNYKILEGLSAKASYAIMNQYVHLLTNSGLGLPTDLWVPATKNIKPQNSDQIAAGLAKDIPTYKLTISLEGYYKNMYNVINYKEGASFMQVTDFDTSKDVNWEENVAQGKGKSYGTELLLQKKEGKFTGWIGYTLSWTKLKFDEINNGKEFYARYDRRHDISIVGIYDINDRITISSTWVYGTGNAITIPLGSYKLTDFNNTNSSYSIPVSEVSVYSERNAFRMEPYHRLDFGIQFHKKVKNFNRDMERTWEFSIYNLYNRKNPFAYGLKSNNYDTHLVKYALFPILPSFSYSLKF